MNRTILRFSLLCLLSSAALAADTGSPAGALPLGKDGRSLNFDFEDGTLRDWTAEGEAFQGQPIKGEINQKRKFGRGRRAALQGEYWIGGYEKLEDRPHGTLTSIAFKVTHPWGAFRIGGGNLPGTRVELVRADTNQVFFVSRGRNSETMQMVAADLRERMGTEIFIRIVDEESGGWGHVNFDDFRFYASNPLLQEPSPQAGPDSVTKAPSTQSAPKQVFGSYQEEALLGHKWSWDSVKENGSYPVIQFFEDGRVSAGWHWQWFPKAGGGLLVDCFWDDGRRLYLKFDKQFTEFQACGAQGDCQARGKRLAPVDRGAETH